jgi:hypothetical protein
MAPSRRPGQSEILRYNPKSSSPLLGPDNILRIHGVHSRVMRLHFDLYIELMRASGPLTRVQRERSDGGSLGQGWKVLTF